MLYPQPEDQPVLHQHPNLKYYIRFELICSAQPDLDPSIRYFPPLSRDIKSQQHTSYPEDPKDLGYRLHRRLSLPPRRHPLSLECGVNYHD